MTIRRAGHLLHWIATLPDGATKTITVDAREANHY
jgi:hypothetical protein